MTSEQAIELIFAELRKAEKKHPMWPNDPIHAAAILGEEAGELLQAAIDFTYGPKNSGQMMVEAAQCAAMGLRFLLGFGERDNGYLRILSLQTEVKLNSPEMQRGSE